MISVSQALDIVSSNSVSTKEIIQLPVDDALGYTLASNLISSINMPPFRQAAMDGFALHMHDDSKYTVIGEIKAGDGAHPKLKAGEAVRIFTGAAVPNSASTVVMQERTRLTNSILSITGPIRSNENIRPLGEQVEKGNIALQKGTKLTAAALAFVSSLGVNSVSVYKKPSVAIVVTGNELTDPGKPLKYGRIFESNAIMLKSALKGLGYFNLVIFKIQDDYNETVTKLNNLLTKYDVVLITGGISVGDYDFVGKALNQLGVKSLFYKVNQKPGKPFFYGKKGNRTVFGLPGNPAAALSCFYVYVYPALEHLSGNYEGALHWIKATSTSHFIKKGDRAQFLKAFCINGEVEILEGQSSAMLHTFALANAMIYIPEYIKIININDKVDVILLPNL